MGDAEKEGLHTPTPPLPTAAATNHQPPSPKPNRYMQHPRKERIVLRDRKGFVRIAVEEGIDGGIVPVYHFGNTSVFDFVPQSLQRTSRRLRSALGFLVGRWGLPVPRRAELFMVSGPPVPVPKVARDSPDFDVSR